MIEGFVSMEVALFDLNNYVGTFEVVDFKKRIDEMNFVAPSFGESIKSENEIRKT